MRNTRAEGIKLARPDSEERVSRAASRRRNSGIVFGVLKNLSNWKGETSKGRKNRLLDEKSQNNSKVSP